jgi:signal transduction histidine kinase/DNA-binding response OmpR family regulator
MQRRWLKFYALIVLTVLPILAVSLSTISLGSQGRASMLSARAAQTAREDLLELSRALLDAETGQRGYLLTGETQYLEPYTRARATLDARRSALLSDMAVDEQASQLAKKLDTLIALKLDEMESAIDLNRSQGSAAALDFIRKDFGKSVMDEVRGLVDQISARMLERSQEFSTHSLGISSFRDRMIAVLAIIGLLAGALAVWVMRQNIRAIESEERLKIEAERAGRESREKSVFLANMSHEIRTPMNAIFGFAQLLENQVHDDRSKFYLGAIRSSGESLLTLINDILDVSKIEAGQLKVSPAPTDLRELIQGISAMFTQMAMQKGLKLTVVVDRSLPEVIKIDAGRLRQVLFNLVGNALKYTDQGEVELRAWSEWADGPQPSVRCVFEVRDTGIGIAQEHLAKIFQPFVQIDDGNSPRAGTGLGLSIVERLVKLLGGRVEVHSRLGQGSTFRVLLDQIETAEKPQMSATPRGSLDDIAPLKILIVDDIELNRELLLGIFESTHHRAAIAVDGRHALERAHELRPDLILMDIRMPGLDGVDVLKRLRENHELGGCKVIAVTASSLLGEEQSLRQIFDGYLRKPFTREALTAEVLRVFSVEPKRVPTSPHAPIVFDQAQIERARELLSPLKAQALAVRTTMSNLDALALIEGLRDAAATLELRALKECADRLAQASAQFDLTAMAHELDAIDSSLAQIERAN